MNREQLITEAISLIMSATDEQIKIALTAALNAK